MSNTEHYKLEADLKDRIASMPEGKLRARLAEFVTEASVSTVDHLAVALGVRPPMKI